MRNIVKSTLLIFLLLIMPVLADGAVALSEASTIILPIVILIEILIFWILNKKIYKNKINIKKIVIVILIANMISTLFGFIFTNDLYEITGLQVGSRGFIHNISIKTFFGFFVYFIISVIIEFFIFFIILRKSYKIKDMLIICIIVNISSYVFLFFSLAYSSYTYIPTNFEEFKAIVCNGIVRRTDQCEIDPVTVSFKWRDYINLQEVCIGEHGMPAPPWTAKENHMCLHNVCGMNC